MEDFFAYSVSCLCFAGAFLLSVMAYAFIKDMKNGEEKKTTVTLFNGTKNNGVYDLDSIKFIDIYVLPNGKHMIAVHLKDEDCYLGTSIDFE